MVAINGGSEKLGGIHAFDIHTGAVVTPQENIEPVQIETVRFYKEYIFTVSQNNGVLDLNALLYIIDIKGKQGDLLILNPYLIHSSSLNDISSKTRITFNLSTEKITK